MHNSVHHQPRPYRWLAAELVADFLIMYFVMFAIIASLDHLRHNLNTVYMTLMMVAPMVVLMILAMRHMFPSKRLNAALLAGSAIIFLGCFGLIRTQTTIGDDQFLRSMIPHHSGAVLMCREASLRDPEIKTLCAGIIRSQRAEIEQMERILARH